MVEGHSIQLLHLVHCYLIRSIGELKSASIAMDDFLLYHSFAQSGYKSSFLVSCLYFSTITPNSVPLKCVVALFFSCFM